jgi:hypothetical protein
VNKVGPPVVQEHQRYVNAKDAITWKQMSFFRPMFQTRNEKEIFMPRKSANELEPTFNGCVHSIVDRPFAIISPVL